MSRPRPRGIQAQAPGMGGRGGSGPGLGERCVCIPACTEADTSQPMATAADGMHTTGMHSCVFISFHATSRSLSEQCRDINDLPVE